MTLYCGIDLHANNSVVAVLDSDDTVHYEKRLANDLDMITSALLPYAGEVVGAVVESTYNWYWLVDGLEDAGFKVHLANPSAICQYEGLKYTNDATDARHLARLLRLGLLPEGHIYPREVRAVRDLLRRRMLMVRQRTTQLLSLQSTITRHTGQCLSGGKIKRLDDEAIEVLLGTGPVALSAKVARAAMHALDHAASELESAAAVEVKDDGSPKLLRTIPGTGQILSLTIALETGDIGRFPNAGHYASYARCVKSEKLSNGKQKGRGNRKNGNKYLAWAFIEAAHFAIRFEPKISAYYQRKRAKAHPMVALKAVAHKLARASYHMLKKRTPFVLNRAFG